MRPDQACFGLTNEEGIRLQVDFASVWNIVRQLTSKSTSAPGLLEFSLGWRGVFAG
jgi:hypothetical protein